MGMSHLKLSMMFPTAVQYKLHVPLAYCTFTSRYFPWSYSMHNTLIDMSQNCRLVKAIHTFRTQGVSENSLVNYTNSSPYIRVYIIGTLFNPLKAKLNLICHLLALLGAHHIFHVSGLRVKSDWRYTHQQKCYRYCIN